jgi:hypothetical protein
MTRRTEKIMDAGARQLHDRGKLDLSRRDGSGAAPPLLPGASHAGAFRIRERH